ncbi:hypothetical protein BJ912DRAFT_960656, partial [Pholiota molesta]
MPLVICNCNSCSKKSYTLHGIQHAGQQVGSSTRLQHEKRDKQPMFTKPKTRAPLDQPSKHLEHRKEISLSESSTFIVKTICLLVVWLHIRAHVSRSVANKLLRAIQFILTTTLSLVEAALGLSGINVLFSGIELPRDIRTAYQLYSIEPEIIRTACCPNCYSLFPQPIPERCQWKASPRSRPCNTKL